MIGKYLLNLIKNFNNVVISGENSIGFNVKRLSFNDLDEVIEWSYVVSFNFWVLLNRIYKRYILYDCCKD